MKPERLDKILAAQSTISRRDVKRLVRMGTVTVNGVLAKSPEDKVVPGQDTVCVGGRPVPLLHHCYLMLYKPKGVVSATRDGRDRTVLDLIPPHLQRKGLFPAGRLDKDTTGFVLLTDDGDFAHRILSPNRHVPKTYIAQLDRPVNEAIIHAFEEGVLLDQRTSCKPAKLRVLEAGERDCVEVVLLEGMYHQIKRMFGHFGIHVLALHRTKIGGLALDESLGPGQCRALTPQELECIAVQLKQ